MQVKIIITVIAVGASLLLTSLFATGLLAESNETNNMTQDSGLAEQTVSPIEYGNLDLVGKKLETGFTEPP